MSSTRNSTGSCLVHAAFSASQNSPSLVEPSPSEVKTISSAWKRCVAIGDVRRRGCRCTPASAAPTACSTCVAVALDPETMFSAVCPQCDGIWRPPLLGSLIGADRREQHVERRDAELQAQRAVAVVRMKPVVAGPAASGRRRPEWPRGRRR